MQKKNYLVVIATPNSFTRNYVFVGKTIEEVVFAIEPKDNETKFLTQGHIARIYEVEDSIGFNIHHKDDTVIFRDNNKPHTEYELSIDAHEVLYSYRVGLAGLFSGRSVFNQFADYMFDELDFEMSGLTLTKEVLGTTHRIEMYTDDHKSVAKKRYCVRCTAFDTEAGESSRFYYEERFFNFLSRFTEVRNFVAKKMVQFQ